jgi:hypothetical protein
MLPLSRHPGASVRRPVLGCWKLSPTVRCRGMDHRWWEGLGDESVKLGSQLCRVCYVRHGRRCDCDLHSVLLRERGMA